MPNASAFNSLQRLHEFINSEHLTQNASPELSRLIQAHRAEFIQVYMSWMALPKTKTKTPKEDHHQHQEEAISPKSDSEHQENGEHALNTSVPVIPLSPWPAMDNTVSQEEIVSPVRDEGTMTGGNLDTPQAPRKAGRPKSAPTKAGFISIQRGSGPERKQVWVEAFKGSGGRIYYTGPSGNKQYIKDTTRVIETIPLTIADSLGDDGYTTV